MFEYQMILQSLAKKTGNRATLHFIEVTAGEVGTTTRFLSLCHFHASERSFNLFVNVKNCCLMLRMLYTAPSRWRSVEHYRALQNCWSSVNISQTFPSSICVWNLILHIHLAFLIFIQSIPENLSTTMESSQNCHVSHLVQLKDIQNSWYDTMDHHNTFSGCVWHFIAATQMWQTYPHRH